MVTGQTKAHFSIPSILAIAAAIGSFYSGAFWGFVLAIVAIVFGVIGLALSMAPSIRGGFVSLFSLMLAIFGILTAVIKAIRWAI